MITVYNASNLAQQWFFKRAYAHLEAENLLPDASKNEQKTFLSLEGYFANIGNLIQLRSEYAMIPSDEEPFVIDANTRNIKIPAAFNKGVAIAGDDMSEVITFTVDRYFDYVDLAGTKICIQWELPGKEGGTGISHVTLIDLETVPGKIRFGWPLTEKLTQYAGKVNFAVRFFVENTDAATNNEHPYNYVLNTATATINIMAGLNLTNPTFPEANVDGEFVKFVQNSQHPSYPQAASPKWIDERDGGAGLDLKYQSPAAIDLDEDTLVLKAQAVVDDQGYIAYKWYFKQGGLDSESPSIEIVDDDRFIVNNHCFEEVTIPADHKRVINEQYYKKSAGDADSYELHVGDLVPEDGPYYQRFTTLTLKKSEEAGENFRDVTGAYWVTAENFTGVTNVMLDPEKPQLGTIPTMNFSTPAASTPCIVPTPADVALTKEPASTVFVEGPVVLSVEATADPSNDIARTYTWYRNVENKEMVMDEAHKVSNNQILNMAEEDVIPGWYYLNLDSQLNRAIKNAKSAAPYRVTNPPIKPTLKLEYCNWSEVMDASEEDQMAFFANSENWTEIDPESENGMMPDAARRGDIVRLRVTPKLGDKLASEFFDADNGLIDNLYTDDIKYNWYIIPVDADPSANVDGEGILLDEKTIFDFSDEANNGNVKFGTPLDKNYLDVWCTHDSTQITSYYCEVINTLKVDDETSKSAAFALADYKHIFNIW